MLNLDIQNNLNNIKKSALVVDIETSAHYSNGQAISIRADIDSYINNAKVKWFGAYSYKNNQQYYLNGSTESFKIAELLRNHNVIVGFNSEEFDFPILNNNGLTLQNKRYLQVDCMQILGKSTSRNSKGYAYKNRGALMNYKFKNNSLKCMAETMKLDFQKGDIDYKIFEQNEWTSEEIADIKKYLANDVMATKQMFDKLWNYWIPFAQLLDEKFVYDLSWLRSSIASLTYKSACNVIGEEPTYSEKLSKTEEMGGRVIKPKYEETKKVWYVDFASLYPHIFTMFNLPAEINKDYIKNYDKVWHGNDVFKVRGYYDASTWHPLSKYISEKLKERIILKKKDKNSPMIYTLKIFCNCFSDDTEIVMADNSIKKIKDCVEGELVYSLNPKTLRVEKKKIVKTFEYDYNGILHHYKGNYFDFKVTPNHNFLVQHKNNKKDIKFIESQNIESQHKIPIHKIKKTNYIKTINILDYINKNDYLYSVKLNNIHGRTWLYDNKLQNIPKKYNENNRNFIYNYEDIKDKESLILNNKNTMVTLLDKNVRKCHQTPIFYDNNAISYIIGIYLAEGSLYQSTTKHYLNGNIRGNGYHINLSQNKIANPVIYNKIIDALNKCGLKYSAGSQCIKVSGKPFYDFLLANFGKKEYKSFQNKKLFDVLNIKMVFQGLIDGDGTKKSRLYTTKYDCLKEDFIEICLRLNYTFNIKNDGCWRIIYNNSSNSFRKANRTNMNYTGKVYCLEIEDNHTMLAGSNNKYNWSGNSLYGVVRSSIFEKVHTPNCGWDCCWLGQQIQKLTEDMMKAYGFETVAGDTDSLFLKATDEEYNNKEYVIQCLNQIIDTIKQSVPFPVDTFTIDIENYLHYVMWPFSEQEILEEDIRKKLSKKVSDGYVERVIDKKKCIIETASNKVVKKGRSWIKERQGKKKNYLYIYEEDNELKVKIVGLPIKKENATPLGIKIFNEVLEKEIIKQKKAKFSKEYIDSIIDSYLKDKEILKLLAVEYKVKAFDTYKKESQIQAQISKGYFDKKEGIISLIKNKSVGKAGLGTKYCTIKEAIDNKLTIKELDLTKLYNEINPFIEYEEK